jgi:hypothetical protein
MKTARTGIAMEKALYLLAQHKAASFGSSFAEYVTSLIAHDLIEYPGADKSATIRRLIEARRKLDVGKALEALDLEVARPESSKLRKLAIDTGSPVPPKKAKAA